MPLFFHQNMRVFGGGSIPRNTVFATAFTGTPAALPGALAAGGLHATNYMIAAFTEIVNTMTSRLILPQLAAMIDPGLSNLTLIQVGTTALGRTVESIGIATAPASLTVTDVGQVLYNSASRSWDLFNTPVAPGTAPPPVVYLPGGGAPLGTDSRGVAYVAGTVGGNTCIFGFVHNMYTVGQITRLYAALPLIAEGLRNHLPGGAYVAAEVFIGGDFNIAPHNPPFYPRWVPLFDRAARVGGVIDPPAPYVLTTNRNTYDYWVMSNEGLTDASAWVDVSARVPLGSDHAASIFLR